MSNPSRTFFDWARFVRQALVLAALMLSSLAGYLAVLKWRGWDAQFITYLPLDELIPYQPVWVWVYLIPYLVGPVVIGLLTPGTFRWYVGRGLAVVLVTLAIFIVCPTQTAPRPSAHGLEPGLTAWMYQNMIEIDEPPANAAPSLHVSLTFLLGLAVLRDFPRWAPLALTCVLLVWLATLFTRQHHLIDVVTGAAVAWVVMLAWRRRQDTISAGLLQDGVDE